ncbi:addiction module antidote protein [Sphingomonas morindae]|uniref:Addiction module antidote protein n=1 Tax=Sphingomonas morindae TaxID=1541170 RepID=A0ABY4X732_9SPHN|nr:addiction module antidote protein [Sphingomonas morindae]USI72727.1 putative addiction module antidote protein [Sphingomonas morindae]
MTDGTEAPLDLAPFDAAAYLTEAEDQDALLAEAFASGDAGFIAHALGAVARARGMAQLARETGIKRQQLYRALSRDGNPTLETLLKVTRALGLRVTAARTEMADPA